MGNASGLFNLLRNLGASFGVALSATILARRSQVHQIFLSEYVTPYSHAYQAYHQKLEAWLATTQDPSLTFRNGALVPHLPGSHDTGQDAGLQRLFLDSGLVCRFASAPHYFV